MEDQVALLEAGRYSELEYVPVDFAAKLLGTSHATLRERVASGRMNGVKVSRGGLWIAVESLRTFEKTPRGSSAVAFNRIAKSNWPAIRDALLSPADNAVS